MHYRHLEMLERTAHAGRAWARDGLRDVSPLFYGAAAGSGDGFREAAERSGQPVTCWDLTDIYAER